MFTSQVIATPDSKRAEILVQAKLIALVTAHPDFIELRDYCRAVLSTLKRKNVIDIDGLRILKARDLK